MYQGIAFSLIELESNIIELRFDLADQSINKFSAAVIADLGKALDALESASQKIDGLLITSAKGVFCIGADITEFPAMFNIGAEAVKTFAAPNNDNFNRIEALPFPTCALINGYALGGGFELALAADYRVMSDVALVGLPETNLGLIPGWGGTVRLPRLTSYELAAQWITSGANQKPVTALEAGAVDAVCPHDDLVSTGFSTLTEHADDYHKRRNLKRSAKPVVDTESWIRMGKMLGRVHEMEPAPHRLIAMFKEACELPFDEALALEADVFAELGATEAGKALSGIFLSDQFLARKIKQWSRSVDSPVTQAAVLGAGIMGGGIAYQSALKKVPILMKDIAQEGLDLGLKETNALLNRRVKRGQMSEEQKVHTQERISAQLDFSHFENADLVIEAVVENPDIKRAALSETESIINPECVLASNTSTISITLLADSLKRPENFCGMHFFNPVHAMPLVEVIKGAQTSDETLAKTVAYANQLGKKAVVVKDCPGFLVNRVLFPYFDGFSRLLEEGADLQMLDKAMERWGWPMGPGYLMDVIGLDTCVHCTDVMAEGYPDRMQLGFQSAPQKLFKAGRLGQKNSGGFYDYITDDRGRLQKIPSEEAAKLLHIKTTAFDEEEIQIRCLMPMATELARCLEEGIIESCAEADMALIYGLGFPRFRGGIFRWMDAVGMNYLANAAERLSHLGPSYHLTPGMQKILKDSASYY